MFVLNKLLKGIKFHTFGHLGDSNIHFNLIEPDNLKDNFYDYEKELKKHNDKISSERKTMVGSGDRSDKIRTYNFPQGRVTDHRIGHTVYNLPNILAGDIQDFIDRLRIAENSERLKDEA